MPLSQQEYDDRCNMAYWSGRRNLPFRDQGMFKDAWELGRRDAGLDLTQPKTNVYPIKLACGCYGVCTCRK